MTVTDQNARTHADHFREELYRSLNDSEKQMYEALLQDAAQAKELSKPFLGLIPRRGQYHFVILRESCDYEEELKKRCRRRSHLTINDTGEATFQVLGKLVSLLRQSGYRANGLTMHLECPRHGLESAYFEYHIDLEAA